LIDQPFNQGSTEAAQEALLAHVGFRSSPRRASADYRRHLVGALFRETIEVAWQRAK
jgi:carbon-monoxide dehydrogenase medium subunit